MSAGAGDRDAGRVDVRVRPGTVGLVARIGGRERLRAILDRFYARLFDDVMVGFFFAGHDRATIVAGQYAFLLRAFGEEREFHGRHPAVAHRELPPILRGQFDRRLQILREVLEAEGLEARDIAAWLRVEESMRRVVQRREE